MITHIQCLIEDFKMTNNIEHSALGSHWTKKNHKYIAIKNGRYIYPDDRVSGSGRHHATKLSREDSHKSPYAMAVRNQRKQDLQNSWQNNIVDPINKVNPIYKSKQKKQKQAEAQARLDAEQRRLDAVNRMNQREQKSSKDYVYSYDQKGVLTKTPKSSSTFKEAEAKRAKER